MLRSVCKQGCDVKRQIPSGAGGVQRLCGRADFTVPWSSRSCKSGLWGRTHPGFPCFDSEPECAGTHAPHVPPSGRRSWRCPVWNTATARRTVRFSRSIRPRHTSVLCLSVMINDKK